MGGWGGLREGVKGQRKQVQYSVCCAWKQDSRPGKTGKGRLQASGFSDKSASGGTPTLRMVLTWNVWPTAKSTHRLAMAQIFRHHAIMLFNHSGISFWWILCAHCLFTLCQINAQWVIVGYTKKLQNLDLNLMNPHSFWNLNAVTAIYF